MQVRTLTFRKQIRPNSHRDSNQWLVMGRLDELEVSASVEMALADIKANNDLTYQKDSEDCYHYIIYLIDREGSQQAEQYRETEDIELWENSFGFLSVTRIHFPATTDLDNQFKALKKHFSALGQDGIAWRVYGTTELSDQILVGRCRSFQQLSRWVLSVTGCTKVGKAYTYFCVPNEMLYADPDSWRIDGDCIEHLSMRFAVKNNFLISDTLNEIREALGSEYVSLPYRVSGNEDAILCGENIPVERIVGLYRTWYQNELRILNTFSDVISRVGTQSFISDDTQPSSKPLTDICEFLLKKFMACPHISGSHERAWRRPLLEMSNALVHMSNSATLDESVYLILPGLYAFWENIEQGNLREEDEYLYLQFVELCVHTMEHLMRAEGQLSQYPEVRPITYDIPVFALEEAIAFLQQLNKALTAPDAEQKRKTSILLVPSAETDVSTIELFPASEHVRGLLQITVPFSMLYEPKYLFLSLCHELAHYVGERCRMREERYRLYINCMASELLFDFFPDCFGETRQLHEFLAEILQEGVEAGEENREAGQIKDKALLEIASTMNDVVEKLGNTEAFSGLVRKFLCRGNSNVRFKYPTELGLMDGVETFSLRNSDLRILFRETFADICMLYFLAPPPKDYLEMVLMHEDNVNGSTCLRFLLALNAVGYGLQEILEIINDILTQKLGNHPTARRQIDDILQQVKALDQLLCRKGFHLEYYLKKYINGCWAELCRCCPPPTLGTIEETQTAAAIYNRIIQPKETFNYRMILQDIDRSRQDILADLR